jgi:phosphotransferase system enzyme I (PtsI)
VVGLRDVTLRAREGQAVVVDGIAGTVTLEPDDREVRRARRLAGDVERAERAMVARSSAPLHTRDGVEIVVRANVEFAAEVDRARRYGASGIGLYRSEFLFLQCSPRFPTEEEHYETYRRLASAFPGHPTIVRTLDLGGEKYFHEILERDEGNPVLGLRGVRLCLRRPDIFRPQIRGLLRAAVDHDIRVMIPLVTFAEEVREVRGLIAAEAAALRGEGIPCREDLPVGIMIEVPAAAVTADLLAAEADFFSIGTNDLIQYGLAVDRGNESVAALYRPTHAAILRMIRFVLRQAAERGIPASMCGEMAGDASLVETLVGLGLREFSVQPRALRAVRDAVRRVDVGAAEDAVARMVGARSTGIDIG